MPAHNLNWSEEELLLACDLAAQNGWRALPETDQQAIALSHLLRQLPIHPADERLPNFRSANSIRRKMADIVSWHPEYPGKRTNASAADKRMLDLFLADPEGMHARAQQFRQAIECGEFSALVSPVEEEDSAVREGRLVLRRHVSRERNPGLRQRKIHAILSRDLPLACEVCEFDFQQVYGERGNGYIECHHVVPLYVAGTTVSRLVDLALLCSNCHRMIHRPPWLLPAELRQEIRG